MQKPSVLDVVEFVIVPVAYMAALNIPEDRAPAWIWRTLAGAVFLAIGGGSAFAPHVESRETRGDAGCDTAALAVHEIGRSGCVDPLP